MRLELDAVEPLVQHLPALGEDRLSSVSRKHVQSRQRYLAHLFSVSYERRRPHAVNPGGDSFERDELAAGLRASRSNGAYKRLLEPFYDFAERSGYSKTRGLTKAYVLKECVWDALDELYAASEPMPLRDLVSGEAVTRMPANGLPEGLVGGLSVPSVVRLGVAEVDRALSQVIARRWEVGPHAPLNAAKPTRFTLLQAERLLMVIRRWVVTIGGIPNLYHLESHGRLGPSGCHLIGMPSLLRHMLLQRSGLMDYDLVACHWSVFLSLGQSIGFDTSAVQDYVGDRARWNERWARISGHGRASDFKAVATSWLTGGSLSSSDRTSSGQLVGGRVMKSLREDPGTRALYEAVRSGMDRIRREALSERDGKDILIPNAVGAVLRTTGSWREGPRINSHLLTGYEQFAIREVGRRTAGLQAIIYDGFIAPRQDVAVLEQHIRASSSQPLGFTLQLRLTMKDLSDPIEHYP